MNQEPRYGVVEFISDLLKETATSVRVMSGPAKAVFVIGFIGFVVLEFFPIPTIPPTLMAYLRIFCFAAFIVGAVANARSLDEFYKSVHLNACAIALPISGIFIYGAASFDIALGRTILGYLVAIWFVSFVYAFARLRHA